MTSHGILHFPFWPHPNGNMGATCWFPLSLLFFSCCLGFLPFDCSVLLHKQREERQVIASEWCAPSSSCPGAMSFVSQGKPAGGPPGLGFRFSFLPHSLSGYVCFSSPERMMLLFLFLFSRRLFAQCQLCVSPRFIND